MLQKVARARPGALRRIQMQPLWLRTGVLRQAAGKSGRRNHSVRGGDVRMESRGEVNQLASWLAVELAPTLAGEKEATILCLRDNRQRALWTWWRRHHWSVLKGLPLQWRVLRLWDNGAVLFFFRPEVLEACFRRAEHAALLHYCGYDPGATLATQLDRLTMRFRQEVPHEMGLFLGIPLKDVLGFMGLSQEGRSGGGLWHVYGDPKPSLERMQRWERLKERAKELLRCSLPDVEVLQYALCLGR